MDITRQLKRVIKLYERFVDATVGYKVATVGDTSIGLVKDQEKFIEGVIFGGVTGDYEIMTFDDGTTKVIFIKDEIAFREFYETPCPPDTTFAGAMAFRCIKDADGLPLAGAVITIQKGTEDAIVLEATDINGLTGIPGLEAGEYTVTVTTTPDGYQTPTIDNIIINDSMALRSVAFTASE